MFDNTKKYGIITKDGYVSVGAPNPDGGIATRYDVKKYVSVNAQEKLVSGTNIKTINNQSILGSGNIDINGGGTSDDVYTKQEADDRFAAKTEISDMLTKTEASDTYQPKGEYATTAQLDTKADKSSVPTKVSQLTNDSNYVNNTQLATKSDKITEISGGNGEVTQELEPNKYYVFGECTTITITLASEVTGIFNEYLFKFTSGSTATVLNLPETCKWIGDNTIEANKEYIVSIVDNMAVLGGA